MKVLKILYKERYNRHTFVVMPNADLPQVAKAGVSRDLENVQAVAGESATAVQVSVATAALTTIQTDTHVGSGAWQEERKTEI